MRRTHNSECAILLLLLVTAALYAHALDFGFIWDDPVWFGRVVDTPARTLISPMPDYQFYRPGTMLYNRLFLRSDETFTASLLHAAQIGWHLLNIALVYALSRRLGAGGSIALAISGLVAWHPFSYQAVAWAAPQQPMAAALQNGAWLAYIEARRQRARYGLAAGVSIVLFSAALSAQESTVVMAVLPLLIEWVMHRRTIGKRHRWLVLVYLLIAAGFGLLWLQIPRQSSYTALTLDGSVGLYLVQGFIFPLIGRPTGYEPGQTTAPVMLLALTGLVLGGLLIAAWHAGRGRQALFGLIWALLGIAPSAVGLRYSYVHLASRLFYYSSAGVALLWACALLPRSETGFSPRGLGSFRHLWRAGGTVLLALILLQSYLLLTNSRRMYTVGVAHLDELIQTVRTLDRADETHLLFVNFPDRYAPRRPPYPLGYWGVTLAPISVDLGAFPAIAVGRHPQTTSCSVPPLDFDARDTGPYQIDMRGEITPPNQLYHLARQVDTVYLSRYSPNGTFVLEWAGAVTTTPSTPSCQLARFGQTICLQQAQMNRQPGHLSLTLTWLSLSLAQPHDTIFAHVGTAYQPPIAQSDGDACLGLLPLNIWQPGDTIREQRIILLPEEIDPAQYEIRIGVYNRETGERLPAMTSEGKALPNDVVVIGHLPR